MSVSYWGVFIFLVCGSVAAHIFAGDDPMSSGQATAADDRFKAFQRKYLLIYYIVMAADWLQGPYVYALYDSYKFSMSEIGALFVGGFLSSMVMGTFVGAVADKFGRKKLCLVFGVTYSLSCLTKPINNFGILMLGRVLSGVSTSLLFSTFESWMVYEHEKNGFAPELLSETFTLAMFGNGIVAILAGLVASFVADSFGYVAPFMVALVLLIAEVFLVSATWEENYGDSRVDLKGVFVNGWAAIQGDKKILYLGVIQSLFEGSMYSFVFMWTPALKDVSGTDPIPFGLVFACFMVAIMIGSSVFKMLLKHFKVEEIGRYTFALASISLAIPVYINNQFLVLCSFLVFELCCGLYFPTQGTLRSKYVPESSRSAVMNLYRVPLNAIVVVLILKSKDLGSSNVFLTCAASLALALLFQHLLVQEAVNESTKVKDSDAEMEDKASLMTGDAE